MAPVANMMHIRPSLKPLLPVFLVDRNEIKLSDLILMKFSDFYKILQKFYCRRFDTVSWDWNKLEQ